MAKYTEHLRLSQPEGSDYYDIEVFNHNSELIDKKIGEMDNSLSTIKEGATREKAGIVQLGTEEGKALEGMMLARLAGAYGYGGDIQDESIKNPNYIYYDRNTRKMYKCLKQNQDISANVANFIPLDNNSLLERLENFSRFEEHLFNIPKLTFGRVTRIANLATLIIDSGQLFYNKNYEVVLNIPENFRPKSTIFFSASYRNTNKSTTFYISPNGDVTKSGVDDDQGAYYFTITYPIN